MEFVMATYSQGILDALLQQYNSPCFFRSRGTSGSRPSNSRSTGGSTASRKFRVCKNKGVEKLRTIWDWIDIDWSLPCVREPGLYGAFMGLHCQEYSSAMPSMSFTPSRSINSKWIRQMGPSKTFFKSGGIKSGARWKADCYSRRAGAHYFMGPNALSLPASLPIWDRPYTATFWLALHLDQLHSELEKDVVSGVLNERVNGSSGYLPRGSEKVCGRFVSYVLEESIIVSFLLMHLIDIPQRGG